MRKKTIRKIIYSKDKITINANCSSVEDKRKKQNNVKPCKLKQNCFEQRRMD